MSKWDASTPSGRRIYPKRESVDVRHRCGHEKRYFTEIQYRTAGGAIIAERPLWREHFQLREGAQDCPKCRGVAAYHAVVAQQPVDAFEGF